MVHIALMLSGSLVLQFKVDRDAVFLTEAFIHPRETGNDEATSFFCLFLLSALGKRCFLCVSALFPCLQALREHLQPCGVGFYFTPICIPLGCGNRTPRVCVLCERHVEASVLVDMSFFFFFLQTSSCLNLMLPC